MKKTGVFGGWAAFIRTRRLYASGAVGDAVAIPLCRVARIEACGEGCVLRLDDGTSVDVASKIDGILDDIRNAVIEAHKRRLA